MFPSSSSNNFILFFSKYKTSLKHVFFKVFESFFCLHKNMYCKESHLHHYFQRKPSRLHKSRGAWILQIWLKEIYQNKNSEITIANSASGSVVPFCPKKSAEMGYWGGQKKWDFLGIVNLNVDQIMIFSNFGSFAWLWAIFHWYT